jgi:hypothetical protein
MSTPSSERHQRVRALALTAGMILGMVATTLGPQAVHASPVKHAKAKPTLAGKIMDLPEATAEQLLAAERVLTGLYSCEFGKRVIVAPDTNKGYFTLQLGKQSWVMKPVLSTTGAIRLEDVKGAALLIQILTKSMLMDPKRGQRMVDGCVHEVQRAAEADLAKQPPRESLLNTTTPGN